MIQAIIVAVLAGVAGTVLYYARKAGRDEQASLDLQASVEAQGRMLQAGADAPHTPDALDERLRRGEF